MKISRSLLLFVLFVPTAALRSQPDDSFVKIFPEKGSVHSNFVDGKTIVAGVEFAGLDVNHEDFGIYLDHPLYETNFVKELNYVKKSIRNGEAFSGYKVHFVVKELKEWISNSNYPHAAVTALGIGLPENQMRLRFLVERGPLVSSIEISFVGNTHISSDELIGTFKGCQNGLWKKYDRRAYEYIGNKCLRSLMLERGFWQGKVVDITSRAAKNVRNVSVAVYEGARYRFGEIKIEGNEVVSRGEILKMWDQRSGEVANGRELQNLLFKKLKEKYDELGYIYYNGEADPRFVEPKAGSKDGVVNLEVTIEEGPQFKVGRVNFDGVTDDEQKLLIEEFRLKTGEVFSTKTLQMAVDRFNESGRFGRLDKDQDVRILTDDKAADIDLVIMVTKPNP